MLHDPGLVFEAHNSHDRYLQMVERDINYYQPLDAGDCRDFAPTEPQDWTA